VFRISRNPLYLGGAGIIGGIGLAFNLPWVLILLGPSIIAGHYVLIAPEERYLAGKFGEPYLRYAASVRRWIGRAEPRHRLTRDQQSPHSSILRADLAAAAGKRIPDVIGPQTRRTLLRHQPGTVLGAVGHHFARPGTGSGPPCMRAASRKRSSLRSMTGFCSILAAE
jgi:hypothetical protein